MENLLFSELSLTPKVMQAIDDMGFETTTSIQSQAIPLIRTGVDVIGRSQTGTGKTIAFAIPAIERIDTHEDKVTVQVLILCPTRELAQQACEELKKLTKYKTGVRAVEVYGGAPMDRQIMGLKKANIVIGTPGRVMDHMRRKTLKLDNLKMIVLDEADEMLSMGFKEDIETILVDTPADRQTILFSATMPPAILRITREFQKTPQLIEINSKQVTIDNIKQIFVEAPMGRKMDALNLLLRFYEPQRALVFCNTKSMVDEITAYLSRMGFKTEGLHGDMKQMQRTKVMDSFKAGKVALLIATDVAARGIDVNDLDYVINYDIPQSTEYYVHRIGRTGRAGKDGCALTICSGRRQVFLIRDIARAVKSEIIQVAIPAAKDIMEKSLVTNLAAVEAALAQPMAEAYTKMTETLIERGHEPAAIAAVMMKLHFAALQPEITEIASSSEAGERGRDNGGFQKIVINIGRQAHVAPNHIVGAITERTGIRGKDVGKIEIFDEKTIVGIPAARIDEVVERMAGCKICGVDTMTTLMTTKLAAPHSGGSRSFAGKPHGGRKPDFHRKRTPEHY